MTITKELTKYNVPDSLGYSFAPGCFGDIEGKKIPILVGFDPQQCIGTATLRSAPDGVLVEFDSEVIDRSGISGQPFAAAGAFKVSIAGPHHFKEATVEACALVRPEDKIR